MAKEVQIYTKTGDDGTTGLIGGTRVKKYDIRLDAYGTIDELNSNIGLLLTVDVDENTKKVLTGIQSRLFVIGSQLAMDDEAEKIMKRVPCREEDIELLEREMDRMFETLPKLTYFILPAGHSGAVYAHLARTVCRRAERRIVELAERKTVDPTLVKYINRLSDYLFVLARKINRDHHYAEVPWIPDKTGE